VNAELFVRPWVELESLTSRQKQKGYNKQEFEIILEGHISRRSEI